MTDDRVEHDSMGDVHVPASARWGATTQRAVENFPISGQRIERAHIEALMECVKFTGGPEADKAEELAKILTADQMKTYRQKLAEASNKAKSHWGKSASNTSK